MNRAHLIALDPNNKQATYLRRACGTARFAYNWALSEWKSEYAAGRKPNWLAIARKLNAIKRTEFPWMLDVTSGAAAYGVVNLGTAFQRFFRKHSAYPKHKKKGVRDRFQVDPDQVKIKGCRVKIPKLGWVKTLQPSRFEGSIKVAVISNSGGRWFISVSFRNPPQPSRNENQAAVGVDLGITALATLSNGEKILGPQPHRALSLRLRRLNKSLFRKKRGSRNRDKTKRKLSRLHARIGNIRRNALHQLTHRLTRDFGVIGIENLNVAGMVRNRSLARSISDMGFFEFKRQLTYKAKWRGAQVLVADRFFPSSKTCSACGLVVDSLPLSIRSWACPCGAEHDRDINAAINILAAGLAVSACGDSSSGLGSASKVKLPSMKQESTHERKDV
jgi:putative transposase